MGTEGDAVDRIVGQWSESRPDLDVAPMAVIGRVSRLARIIDRRLGEHFATYGIEAWMYDVLATLRRGGEPYELSPGDLVDQTMVTTGAVTNRLDRLEQRGLVERRHSATDRRRVVVRLTTAGLELVDRVAPAHYELEGQLLAALSPAGRESLVELLRTVLIDLGDSPS